VACSERGKAKWAQEMLQQIGAQEAAELDLHRETEAAA